MGTTGKSFGVHLHFGVYFDKDNQGDIDHPDEAVDPFGWCGSGDDPYGSTKPKNYYLWIYRVDECIPSDRVRSLMLTLGANPVKTESGMLNQGTTSGRSFHNVIQQILLIFGIEWEGSTLRLTVYDPAGNVYAVKESSTPPIVIQIPNASPGAWSYSVTAIDVPYDNYPYVVMVGEGSISVLAQPATPKPPRQEDGYEPDNSQSQARTITGPELHNFCGPKDEDWVKFFVPSGWTVHVKAAPPSNFPTEPRLELYGNGGLVAQNDHYFGNIAEIWYWNNGPDQTFYVRATELKGRGDCGSSEYTLSVEQFQGAPVQGTPAPTNTATPTRSNSVRNFVASTPSPQSVRQVRLTTPTAPATLIAKALTVPTLASTALNSSVQGQTRMALGSRGGTVRNSEMGAQVTFASGTLADDAIVIVQSAAGLSQTTTNKNFAMIGEPLEIAVMRGNGNIPSHISNRPMRLCLDYTDEQLAEAGGDVGNLAILQEPGTPEEAEATRSRAFGARRICVDVEDASTFALAVRLTNREGQIILAQGLVNVLSLALLSGSALLAFAAFALRGGWLRRG